MTKASQPALALVGALGLILLLASCTTTKFTFRGVSYDSPDTFLTAMREAGAQDVATINPTQTPVGGSAVYIAPSPEYLINRGLRVRVAEVGPPSGKDIDTVIAAAELSFRTYGNALQRRRIFDDVVVLQSEAPDSVRRPEYDVSIYPVLSGPTQVQWFLTTSPHQSPRPIYFDTSLPAGGASILSWLEGVERLAREQLRK